MAKTKAKAVPNEHWERSYNPNLCSDAVPPVWNAQSSSKRGFTQNKVNKEDH